MFVFCTPVNALWVLQPILDVLTLNFRTLEIIPTALLSAFTALTMLVHLTMLTYQQHINTQGKKCIIVIWLIPNQKYKKMLWSWVHLQCYIITHAVVIIRVSEEVI